jgi:hypothetical protein
LTQKRQDGLLLALGIRERTAAEFTGNRPRTLQFGESARFDVAVESRVSRGCAEVAAIGSHGALGSTQMAAINHA